MEITLERIGQKLIVHAQVPGLVEQFSTVQYLPLLGGEYSFRVEPRRTPLIWHETNPLVDHPFYACYAGLEPLVVEWLQRQGHTVRLAGERPKRLKSPNPEYLQEFKPVDGGMLDFLRERDRAIVRYQPNIKLESLVCQICKAWPHTEIMVWVTRVHDATRIAKYLRKAGLHPTVLSGQHDPDAHAEPNGRIVISTYTALNDGLAELDKRAIAIVADTDEFMRSKWRTELLIIERAKKARLWGFLPADKQLAPYDRDMITAAFGTEELSLIRHGEVWQPPTVVFSRIAGGQPLGSTWSVFQVSQQGIWHNRLRNRRIVKLAKAISQYDETVLEQDYPEVYEQLDPQQRHPLGILVENVEHGLELAKMLPDWQLIAEDEVYEDDLSAMQRKALRLGRECECWLGESRIVTAQAFESAGKFSVIIRADGGTGLPCGNSKYSKDAFAKFDGLLIDFNDKHHPLLQEHYKQRHEAYRAAGWDIAGMEIAPLDAFMASRPKGARVAC